MPELRFDDESFEAFTDTVRRFVLERLVTAENQAIELNCAGHNDATGK